MAAYFVTSIAPGQWFYSTDASPDAVISAPRGSVAVRTDAGNESLWINVTAGAAPGTNWERIISPDINGDLDLTGVDQITLLDNANPALDIGSTGLLNLLRFVTTNGAEAVEYNGPVPLKVNTGGLNVVAGTVAFPNNTVNVATAAIAAGNEVVAASLTLRVTHPGGAVTEPVVLPVRAGGWRVLDAMVVASAAGGGGSSVQVQTVAAAAVSSVLTIDGAVVAGSVVRTTSLLNTVFASGATINVVGVGTPAANNVFITLAPL
jgi:hypothetical protein